MPTYTYACKDCDERVDVVRSFSEGPLAACPTCGGEVRQVFKPAGIVFKGSGWHIKDYADKGGSSGASSTSSDGGGDSGSSSSGDSSSSTSSSTSKGSSGSSPSSGSSGSSTAASTSSSSTD